MNNGEQEQLCRDGGVAPGGEAVVSWRPGCWWWEGIYRH